MLSLDNVIKLKQRCFANNELVCNAIAWHIYNNYSNLVLHIIATKSEDIYYSEYKEAINYMKKNRIKVLIHSRIKMRHRLAVIIEPQFPKLWARYRIYKHNKYHLKEGRS